MLRLFHYLVGLAVMVGLLAQAQGFCAAPKAKPKTPSTTYQQMVKNYTKPSTGKYLTYYETSVRLGEASRKLGQGTYSSDPEYEQIMQTLMSHQDNLGRELNPGNVTIHWYPQADAMYDKYNEILWRYSRKIGELHNQRQLGPIPRSELEKYENMVKRFKEVQQGQMGSLIKQQLTILRDAAMHFSQIDPKRLNSEQTSRAYADIRRVKEQADRFSAQIAQLAQTDLMQAGDGLCQFRERQDIRPAEKEFNRDMSRLYEELRKTARE